ncbi:ribonuclease HII [bacterium]|nr:ribonuclease HII [bacterium]
MKNNLVLFDEREKGSFDYLIGTDEAGRGPGAGSVYAAAVCFVDCDKELIEELNRVNDSKQLSEQTREELYEVIKQNCIYSVRFGTVEDIEKYNILRTSLNTMKLACEDVISQLKSLYTSPSPLGEGRGEGLPVGTNVKVIIDGNKLIPMFKYPQKYIIKGDANSFSIAAASILAKVERDREMTRLSKEFPEYLWDKNKGYLTKEHLDAIDKYGLTKWHRKSFLQKHFEKCEQLSLF